MKTYIFNGKTYENISELMSDIDNEIDIDEHYDDMLDDSFGDINICGCDYSASIALFRVDEITYNVGKYDYQSSVLQDIEYEIERLDDGDGYNNFDIEVECRELDDYEVEDIIEEKIDDNMDKQEIINDIKNLYVERLEINEESASEYAEQIVNKYYEENQ